MCILRSADKRSRERCPKKWHEPPYFVKLCLVLGRKRFGTEDGSDVSAVLENCFWGYPESVSVLLANSRKHAFSCLSCWRPQRHDEWKEHRTLSFPKFVAKRRDNFGTKFGDAKQKSVKKSSFSHWMRAKHSVNEGFGKEIQWRGQGHSVNNWTLKI